MPAYSVDLRITCAGCPRPATHEVRNGQNAPMGRYCERCADAKVAKMNRGQE